MRTLFLFLFLLVIILNYISSFFKNYILGVPECCRRIAELVSKAKDAAGIPQDQVLHSLGMSLSGADYQERMDEISNYLLENFPQVKYIVIIVYQLIVNNSFKNSMIKHHAHVLPPQIESSFLGFFSIDFPSRFQSGLRHLLVLVLVLFIFQIFHGSTKYVKTK